MNKKATGDDGSRFIPLEKLIASTTNPRKYYEPAALAALVKSINQNGVMLPLIVRDHPNETGKFEIIAGERRFRAAKKSHWKAVPCRVMTADDSKALIMQADENLNRVNLNPLEEAAAFQNLIDAGLKQEAIAEKYECHQSHISNRLRLLKLPKVWQKRLITGAIPVTFARELAAWVDHKEIFYRLESHMECHHSHLAPGQNLEMADLRDMLAQSICDISQPIEAAAPLILTPKLKKQLQVIKLPENLFNPGTERIFCDVWDLKRMVEEAEAQQEQETAASPAEATPSQDETPADYPTLFYDDPETGPGEPETAASAAGTNARTAEDIQADTAHAQQVADRNKANKGPAVDYSAYKRDWIKKQITARLDDPKFLDNVFVFCLDSGQDWKPDKQFLELHNRGQLIELARDWGLDVKRVEEYEKVTDDLHFDMLTMTTQQRMQFGPDDVNNRANPPHALIASEVAPGEVSA